MPDAPNANPAADPDPKRRKLDDGDTLKINDYTIDFSKKLGAGTFGEVYKATGPARYGKSRANYAIKIAQDTERNRNEVKLLKDLQHVNVVELVESIAVKKLGAKLLLVMPQAAGTLADMFKKKPGLLGYGDAFFIYERWECANQLLVAVDYLHTKQPCVIHRDLKPANILLYKFKDSARDEGTSFFFVWKVADFGLGKELAAGGSVAAVHTVGAGTPKYMAPEVAAGGAYSKAADLYSLGGILKDLFENSGNEEAGRSVWEILTNSDPQGRHFGGVVSALDDFCRAPRGGAAIFRGSFEPTLLPRFFQRAHPGCVGAWLRCPAFLSGFFQWNAAAQILDMIQTMMSRRELVPFVTGVFADGKYCTGDLLFNFFDINDAVRLFTAVCAVGFSSGAEAVLRRCCDFVWERLIHEDGDGVDELYLKQFLQIFLDKFGTHATDVVLRSLGKEYQNDKRRMGAVMKFRTEKLGDLAPVGVS